MGLTSDIWMDRRTDAPMSEQQRERDRKVVDGGGHAKLRPD